MKKNFSIILAVMVVFGMLLTACGTTTTEVPVTTSTESAPVTGSENKASEIPATERRLHILVGNREDCQATVDNVNLTEMLEEDAEALLDTTNLNTDMVTFGGEVSYSNTLPSKNACATLWASMIKEEKYCRVETLDSYFEWKGNCPIK